MKVEIWSDIMCPFCYIGKRRFEAALDQFGQKDQVEVVWRSYQLDPGLKASGTSIHQYLADRKGVSVEEGKRMNDYVSQIAAEVGLEYNFDRTIVNNTLDAHRLLHLAADHGIQNEMKERLFNAYYTEGKDIGDTEVLVEIGESLNLDASEIRNLLASDKFTANVYADQREAEEIGSQGVPFFVLNRKYGVSGAQPVEVFADVLQKVWEEERPSTIGSQAPSCGTNGDCC